MEPLLALRSASLPFKQGSVHPPPSVTSELFSFQLGVAQVGKRLTVFLETMIVRIARKLSCCSLFFANIYFAGTVRLFPTTILP